MRKAKADTERLPVTIARASRVYLAALAETGTYGTSVTDVAKALIEQGIRQAIKEGFLKAKVSVDQKDH